MFCEALRVALALPEGECGEAALGSQLLSRKEGYKLGTP